MILGINIEWWILYGLILFCWVFFTVKAESYTTYVVRRIAPELMEVNGALRRCEQTLGEIKKSLREADEIGTEIMGKDA